MRPVDGHGRSVCAVVPFYHISACLWSGTLLCGMPVFLSPPPQCASGVVPLVTDNEKCFICRFLSMFELYVMPCVIVCIPAIATDGVA